MTLASPATLLLAAVVSSPALYQAFVTHEMDMTTAGFRYMLAVPVCGIMVSMLNSLTASYQDKQLAARDEARLAARAEARQADVLPREDAIDADEDAHAA